MEFDARADEPSLLLVGPPPTLAWIESSLGGGFAVRRAARFEPAPPSAPWAAVVAAPDAPRDALEVARAARGGAGAASPTFTIVLCAALAASAAARLDAFAAGARMIANDLAAALEALRRVRAQFGPRAAAPGATHACGWCGVRGLSADALREHLPLYHGCEPSPPW